jgi:hypothetical protein
VADYIKTSRLPLAHKAGVARNDFFRQFAPQQAAKLIKSRATELHLHCELPFKIISSDIGLN